MSEQTSQPPNLGPTNNSDTVNGIPSSEPFSDIPMTDAPTQPLVTQTTQPPASSETPIPIPIPSTTTGPPAPARIPTPVPAPNTTFTPATEQQRSTSRAASLHPEPSTSASGPTTGSAPGFTMPSEAAPHGAPVRQYINSKITGVLLEGMKIVARDQPKDPLRVLGEFLLQRSKELEGRDSS